MQFIAVPAEGDVSERLLSIGVACFTKWANLQITKTCVVRGKIFLQLKEKCIPPISDALYNDNVFQWILLRLRMQTEMRLLSIGVAKKCALRGKICRQ